MTADDHVPTVATPSEIGSYCRLVEAHLTRVNGGHLVRIVGPGFDLVRRWAEQGVPIGIVLQAVEAKAARHKAGASPHALRIEYCERDVQATFDHWRRAVGLGRGTLEPDASAAPDDVLEERRRPSLSKQVDRAIDLISRAAGRLETPDALRDGLASVLEELTLLRDQGKGARGPARDAVALRVRATEARLLSLVRAASPPEVLEALGREAEHELGPYRNRLTGAAWEHGVHATVDRLLRERHGLPALEVIR